MIETMKLETPNACAELPLLRRFVPHRQLVSLVMNLDGEEGAWFWKTLAELAELIRSMPQTYEQDGKGKEAVAYLHYFGGGGADFFITEKDMETEQLQAFGAASYGYGFELGYISLVDALKNGLELDLHFKPQTLRAIYAEREAQEL
jgi:hypothetical protein